MNTYAKSADAYLVQRVMGAGPEQQAALLMEAGQLFLGKAIRAIEQQEHQEIARCLSRVTEIITESLLRLNVEDGGELVDNLEKVYNWWTAEVFEASKVKDVKRLGIISDQMGEIREAWEQCHTKQISTNAEADSQISDRVV